MAFDVLLFLLLVGLRLGEHLLESENFGLGFIQLLLQRLASFGCVGLGGGDLGGLLDDVAGLVDHIVELGAKVVKHYLALGILLTQVMRAVVSEQFHQFLLSQDGGTDLKLTVFILL